MKEFKLAFGRGVQSVMLPEDHISDVLEGVPTPACDVKEATLAAMRSPLGSAPLKEVVKSGDKVCLVVADITREGGFPPLLLDPIDFGGLYVRRQQELAAKAGKPS